MARTDVFLNINANDPAEAVVLAQQTLTAADFPTLVLGDTPLFSFYFTDGTAVWPTFAGDPSYSITWALSDSIANDQPAYALQTASTPLTGGWAIRLPVNTGTLINACASKRVGQAWPVVQLWSHLRVTDPGGFLVSYALIRTNVRLRAIGDTQLVPNAPIPAGTQYVLADETGALSSPSNFFEASGYRPSYNAQTNTSGNSEVAPSTLAFLHTEVVTVAGSGSTTRVAYVSTAGRSAGDRCTLRFVNPTTAAITVELRNATAGGTLLTSYVTDGSGDDCIAELYYTGTAWAFGFFVMPANA
jgi:hypothetical protein